MVRIANGHCGKRDAFKVSVKRTETNYDRIGLPFVVNNCDAIDCQSDSNEKGHEPEYPKINSFFELDKFADDTTFLQRLDVNPPSISDHAEWCVCSSFSVQL